MCGFEVAFRLARATQARIENFYWSSVRSVFGSAAASGKVIGLDHKGLLNTLGITGSLASGLHEHTHTNSTRDHGETTPGERMAGAIRSDRSASCREGHDGAVHDPGGQTGCLPILLAPKVSPISKRSFEGGARDSRPPAHRETKPDETMASAAGILDALSQAREEAVVPRETR